MFSFVFFFAINESYKQLNEIINPIEQSIEK